MKKRLDGHTEGSGAGRVPKGFVQCSRDAKGLQYLHYEERQRKKGGGEEGGVFSLSSTHTHTRSTVGAEKSKRKQEHYTLQYTQYGLSSPPPPQTWGSHSWMAGGYIYRVGFHARARMRAHTRSERQEKHRKGRIHHLTSTTEIRTGTTLGTRRKFDRHTRIWHTERESQTNVKRRKPLSLSPTTQPPKRGVIHVITTVPSSSSSSSSPPESAVAELAVSSPYLPSAEGSRLLIRRAVPRNSLEFLSRPLPVCGAPSLSAARKATASQVLTTPLPLDQSLPFPLPLLCPPPPRPSECRFVTGRLDWLRSRSRDDGRARETGRHAPLSWTLGSEEEETSVGAGVTTSPFFWGSWHFRLETLFCSNRAYR